MTRQRIPRRYCRQVQDLSIAYNHFLVTTGKTLWILYTFAYFHKEVFILQFKEIWILDKRNLKQRRSIKWTQQRFSCIYIPVSYTHLDVYKRQLLMLPNESMKVYVISITTVHIIEIIILILITIIINNCLFGYIWDIVHNV